MRISGKISSESQLIIANLLGKMLDLFNLFIAMVLSEYLLKNIVFGGALYLMGQVWVVFARLYGKHAYNFMPFKFKAAGVVLFIVAILLNAALIILYPTIAYKPGFLFLIIALGISMLRQMLTSILTNRLKSCIIKRILILFSIHCLFSALMLIILYPVFTTYEFNVMLGLIAASTLLSVLGQLIISLIPVPKTDLTPDDSMLNVSSYRIYNKMTAHVFMAVNISILSYICYLRFQPFTSAIQGFLYLCMWMALMGGTIAICYVFLNRNVSINKYDKPSVFVLGAVLWSTATIITTWNLLSISLTSILLTNALWCIGLACMLSIIVSLGSDMKKVLEFGLGKMNELAYRRNTEIVTEWSWLLSSLLMVLMFTIAGFIMDGKLDMIYAVLGASNFMHTIMLWIPMISVLSALIYALMQPLDKNYLKKLKLYNEQAQSGKPNMLLYERLQNKLVKGTKRAGYRLLRIFIRPFLRCRVVNKQFVNVSNGPVVFVCNHLEVYGPMITNLYMPFYFRPWVISKMLNKDEIANQLERGVLRVLRFLPKRLISKIPKYIAPLMLKIMDSTEPIPVYRDSGRDIIKTIRLTVDAMEFEDNILIFPENPTINDPNSQFPEYGVAEFYTGFFTIAEQYYKRAKKCTTFYPIYVDKKKHTLTFGTGIKYNPKNIRSEEKERITSYLHDWMSIQSL
ncbi:MAG: hypothetical protein R2876_05100 [Eubacteriales bacterium]